MRRLSTAVFRSAAAPFPAALRVWRRGAASVPPTGAPPPTTGVPSAATAAAASSAAATANTAACGAGRAESIAALLEQDPQLLQAVVERMSADQRRRLIVAGGAYEWFGKERVSAEVLSADADKDRVISPKDFDKWFESALKRRVASGGGGGAAAAASGGGDTGGAAASAATPEAETASVPGTAGPGSSVPQVPFQALCIIALEAGLPFVGFGFLDNATMILAGDAIDQSVGVWLNCSVMASAAMGNIVSGSAGMQIHGFVEKLVMRMHLPVPVLSDEQRRSSRVFLAGHLGGTIGIAFGLTLGMLPLLWIHDEDEKMQRRVFASFDTDHDGYVTAGELQRGLEEVGIVLTDAQVAAIVSKYHSGTDRTKVDWEHWKQLCAELKPGAAQRHHHGEAAKAAA